MKIIVIGAAGTIGQAVTEALASRHDLLRVGRSSGDYQADITSPSSLQSLFEENAPFDAVVCAAGEAAFNPLPDLTDADIDLSLSSKLRGQIDLVRAGLPHVEEGGSFTLTSGILSQHPMPGSAAISMVNAGVEAFARAAALDMPRSIRINVVSPPWVSATLKEMGRDPDDGLPASTVARAYVDSVEGNRNGDVLDAREYQ